MIHLSILLQQTYPDTSSYLYAGYALIFVITVCYLLSLSIRYRQLEKGLSALEASSPEKEEENEQGQVP